MLSDSLDPDLDLQSGSKLFTWYDVCCIIRGGGICPSCKIQRGGLRPSCKIQRGGLCPSCKIHGGDFVHVYKNEQGGFCPGGIMSVSLVLIVSIDIRRETIKKFLAKVVYILENLSAFSMGPSSAKHNLNGVSLAGR